MSSNEKEIFIKCSATVVARTKAQLVIKYSHYTHLFCFVSFACYHAQESYYEYKTIDKTAQTHTHTQKYITWRKERGVLNQAVEGRRESWMAVQPQTGIAAPEGNGDTKKEVPGTVGRVRRGSSLPNSLTRSEEAAHCQMAWPSPKFGCVVVILYIVLNSFGVERSLHSPEYRSI